MYCTILFYPILFYSVLFYSINFVILSREAYSVFSGSLSFLHLSPDCRCPPSHPVVPPLAPSTCTQHTGLVTDRGSVVRLNANAHTPSFSNDNDTNSFWKSQNTRKMVNVTYVLSDVPIEVRCCCCCCCCFLNNYLN